PFVFGDNFARFGKAGQAAEMRDEPNAVGIPTKAYPGNDEKHFLSDSRYDEWLEGVAVDVLKLLLYKGTVVWPMNGIGTGRAELRERAPRIYKAIKRIEHLLEAN
ncbi:hypothetical protein LCGC14_2869550, partial [marine sediment metagenome]